MYAYYFLRETHMHVKNVHGLIICTKAEFSYIFVTVHYLEGVTGFIFPFTILCKEQHWAPSIILLFLLWEKTKNI